MLINLGSPLYFLVAQFIYTPIFYLMSVILKRCGSPRALRMSQWFSRQTQGIFFNTILATLDGFFIVMIFSSMMNIQNEDKAGGYDLSYFLSILCFAACMQNLILVSIYFCRYRNNLNEEGHRNRCG